MKHEASSRSMKNEDGQHPLFKQVANTGANAEIEKVLRRVQPKSLQST